MKTKIIIVINIVVLCLAFLGCKKWVEVDGPKTSVNSANIYEKDATAASVLTGIYANLSASGIQDEGLTGISYSTGLSSDELELSNGIDNQVLTAYYTNTLGRNIAGFRFWSNIYSNLFVINSAIEGLSKATTLTPAVQHQLLGEAKFLRAFCFFYLVNLYGNVPLATTTDYKVNSVMKRDPVESVWAQIVSDLKDAQGLLSSEYLDATLLKISTERLRPTTWAATALLARVYLYSKNWKLAEEQSSVVLNNLNYKLGPLDDTFLRTSKEAIWQLQPVCKGCNTQEAISFIIDTEFGPDERRPAYLNPEFVDGFEVGDQRKISWINSITIGNVHYSYPYKYKIVNLTGDPDAAVYEYSTILRLAEQYLIRAESRVQQGNISQGLTDVNLIRDRATDKTAPFDSQLKSIPLNLSKENALLVIERERRLELFTEWGHRWFDLKRTGRVDQIMTREVPIKSTGGVWKSYQQLYPINPGDIKLNPVLTQNSGY